MVDSLVQVFAKQYVDNLLVELVDTTCNVISTFVLHSIYLYYFTSNMQFQQSEDQFILV